MENSRPAFTQEVTTSVSISQHCSQAVHSGAAERRAALFCRAPVWLLPVNIQTTQNSRIPHQEALPGRKVPFSCLVLVWPELKVNTKPETVTPLSSVHSWVHPMLCTGSGATETLKFQHYSSRATPPADLFVLPNSGFSVFRVRMVIFNKYTSPHQFFCTTGKPHTHLQVELLNISLKEWISFSSSLLCIDVLQAGLFW